VNEEQVTSEELADSFSVVFRENPSECMSNESVFVVGSLMEIPPDESQPYLSKVLGQQKHEVDDLKRWFAQYLTISLQPIIHIFAEYGVSLEVHAQNSLVMIENGLPTKLYVRDLERISISREKAAIKGWNGHVISDESPVLYEEDEAWLRLKYYFVVNHLGYVVRTLAKINDSEEYVYWSIVRDVLEELKVGASRTKQKYINDLLCGQWLPAKANLISRFQERGETPLYVDISNPIYDGEVK
jgi:siderophore synthetase component